VVQEFLGGIGVEIVLIAIIVFLALALIWAYRKGHADGVKLFDESESPETIYKHGYNDALAAREPDAATYKRGFEDGFRIGNLKDKAATQEVAAALREPVKQKPVPPDVEKEQRRYATILQNIANTGTGRRQIDVE
jgi:hypothetical protein